MRSALYDIVNGIYSGIPVCCIRFFIHERKIGGEVGTRIYEGRGNPGNIAGYVQCDKCYDRGHAVKIRHNGNICYWLLKVDIRWQVQCWESEAGWGTSSMGVHYFDTKAKADAYVLDYNKDNTSKTVPSHYFYADSPVQV